jgi:predicted MFS family arabinose efflux permease
VLRLFALLVFFSATAAALPETLAPVVLEPDAARASLLLAAAPLGQAVTIVILGRTTTVTRPWFQLWHLVLLAGGLTIASVAPGFEGLLAANVVVGVGVAWVLGPQLTFLRLVPSARMAQVTGAMWAAIAVAEGGGALLFGAIADATSPRSAYLAAGVVVAITAVLGITVARRSDAVTAFERRIRDEVLV